MKRLIGFGFMMLLAVSFYTPLTAQETACNPDYPSRLQVGMLANVISADATVYYGHPLIEDAFFADPYGFTAVGTVFLIEGPYCVTGNTVWKIGDMQTNFVTGWVYETAESGYLLEPTLAQIAAGKPFTLRTQVLSMEESAPIIGGGQQIAFIGQGGGGGGPLWIVKSNCELGETDTQIRYLGYGGIGIFGEGSIPRCMVLYPFTIGETVTVNLYQPDGTAYLTQRMTAREIQGSTQDVDGSGGVPNQAFTFGGLEIYLPDAIGLMTGIWRIEAIGTATTLHAAYELIRPTKQLLEPFCIGNSTRLALMEFTPNAQMELVLIEGRADREIDLGPEGDFVEIQRWAITLDENGYLAIQTDFLPPIGYWVVVSPGQAWQERLNLADGDEFNTESSIIYNGVDGQWSIPTYIRACATEQIQPDEINTPLVGQFGLGDTLHQYPFTAQANTTLNVIVAQVFEPEFASAMGNFAAVLRLYAPNGDLLQESDTLISSVINTPTLQFDEVSLPEIGEYLLEVEYISAELNEFDEIFYALYLTGEGLLSTDDNPQILQYGDRHHHTLSAEIANWTFMAAAGDTVSISVQSDDFDVQVALLDVNSNQIAQDDDSGLRTDAQLRDVLLAEAGEYTIQVSGWGGKGGEYTIMLNSGSSITVAVPEMAFVETTNSSASGTEIVAETTPEPCYAQVDAGRSVRLRSGPSTDFSIVQTTSGGEKFVILSKTADGWYELENGLWVGDSVVTAVGNCDF